MENRLVKIAVFMMLTGFVVAGCSDKTVSAKDPVLGKIVNRTLMKVDNLSCGSCVTTISEKLSTFEGVVGLGADLGQGMVAVDHTKAIESSKIAEAITSIGYPAKIVSETEIDSSKAFVSNNTRQYGGGGCCSVGSPSNISTETKKGDGSFFSDKGDGYSTGCPYIGSVRSRGCYASSASWKELVQRFSDKPNKEKGAE